MDGRFYFDILKGPNHHNVVCVCEYLMKKTHSLVFKKQITMNISSICILIFGPRSECFIHIIIDDVEPQWQRCVYGLSLVVRRSIILNGKDGLYHEWVAMVW